MQSKREVPHHTRHSFAHLNPSRIRTALLAGVLAIVTLAFSAPAQAQAVYGNISGTVTDASGAAVPNANVTVTDLAKGTSKTAQSNAEGLYTINQLIPDAYSVKAEAANFTPAEAASVTVSADTTQTVNLQVAVGGASQTVTVTAEAAALKTDRADVAQVLGERAVQSLPNINRNFTQFELLTPGVQRSSFNIGATENPQGSQAVSINGSNYGTTGWILDGTDNRDPVLGIIVINPTLDSISEMKVTSQNYTAEFGGAVGGVITAQTRSGSNGFHGDAFEFRRSDAQLARDPFTQFAPDPVTGKYIPSQLYNQFGGSLGGPIKKDKAFFFLDYQGTRQRVGVSHRETVPTALVRSTCLAGGACDLSQYVGAGVLRNPVTGARYANGIIPAGNLSPQAIALLQALPAPNSGAPGLTSLNYTASGNGRNDGDQADVRVDWQTTPNIHSFARYDYANFRLFGTPVFGAAGGEGFGLGNSTGNDNVQNQSAAAGFDWALRPSLLTDFRFGYINYHVAESKFDAGTTPSLNAGIPNANTGAYGTDGSQTYNITGDSSISPFGTQGCNCPLLQSEQVFQLVNNWTKIFGNHSVRFGGDIRYALNLRNASDYNRAGQYTFGNGSTADVASGSPGLALASILLGTPEQYQRFVVFNQNAANRQKRGAFYAQDTWRIGSKLTLDYGVRWDLIYPETVNSNGAGGFTYPYQGYTQVAGIGAGTNGGEKMDYLNLAGRFGFAYQIRNGTVIRGAIGQVYDNVGFFGTIFGSTLTHNTPVYIAQDIDNNNAAGGYTNFTLGTTPAAPGQPAIPANGQIPMVNGQGYQFRSNRLLLPKVDQYNLSLQQQITSDLTATIAYVGNIGERVYPGETYGYDINAPLLPTTPAQLAAGSTNRRPFYQRYTQTYNGTSVQCCDTGITSANPDSRSSYNSLQASMQQRFRHGFQLLANYTWSKSLNYDGGNTFQNYRRVGYGPSDTNHNQVFVLSGSYELPFGKGKMVMGNANRLLDYAVGGWQLNGTTTWQTGLPFTPTYGECGQDQDVDNNSSTTSASSACRPNKVGGGNLPLSVGSFDSSTHTRRFFAPVTPLATNGAVSGPFARPAFGTFGNYGRNSLYGPSQYFADAALFKNFSITERVKGQFQFQAFNVFNHAPLGFSSGSSPHCIDCSTGSSNAGQIVAVDPAVSSSNQPYMRQLQFGARISF